jgi:hypothetical protein
MKVRYAKNLITGSVETQSGGTEGNQADLDLMRSNMIGDGSNGLTPSDVEIGWEERETVEEWITAFRDSLKTYADKRKAEYPSIQDLVVALYDTNDKAAIDAKRADIKLKYPKP